MSAAPAAAPGWIRQLTAACRRHGRLAAITLTVTLGAVAADLVAPLLARSAIDHATGTSRAAAGLGVLVAAMLVAAVIRYACQFGRRLTAGRLSVTVQDDLRRDLLRTLLRVDGRSQDALNTGQVVSRAISDLQVVQGLLAQLPLAIGGVVQAVLAIGIMAWLSPALTLIALVVLPLVSYVAYRARRPLFAATWSAQQSAADLAGHVEETVTGVRVVKGFGQESRAVDELAGLGAELYRRKLRSARLQARFAPVMAALPQIGMVLVIGAGGYLTLQGSLSAGSFLAFSTYIASMTAVVRILTGLLVSGQLAASSASRVFEVIDHPADPALSNTATVPDGPLGVRLTAVDFGYRDRPVLRGVDLDLAPGECVAVVGGPGSGKSTLAALLGGTYPADAGTVALIADGREYPVDRLAPSALHATVTVAFDEPVLFSDTIAENIALGPGPAPAPDDPALRRAADRACATGFIDELPDGFATAVGERGLTLSGGQRQRIALARALYAQPRVLVLDDATSAVDAATEAQILNRLREDGTTVLVLAHRRSTLSVADRVVVLDDGAVIDTGTVTELDARCPRFAELMTPGDDDRAHAAALRRVRAQQALTVGQLWPDAPPDQPEPVRTRGPAAQAATAPRPGGRGGGPAAGAFGALPATPELQAAVEALPPADEQPRVDLSAARAERRGFSLRQILRPVRGLLVLVLLTVAADTLIGLVYPSLARVVLDAGTHGRSTTVAVATVGGLLLVAVGALAGAANVIVAARAGERVLYALRVRSYAHLQRLGLDYYERELSGRIMTRMTTDVDALSNFIQTGLSSAVIALLTVVGVLAALFVTDWHLALLVLPVFPILVVATVVFRRIAASAYTRSRELVSVVNADFQENVTGLRTTVAYRHDGPARRRFGLLCDAWVAARMDSQRAISVYFPFITFCADVAAAVAVGAGAHQIATGHLTPGALVAFVLYLSMLFGPVQQLTQVFDGYQQAAVGLRRIGDLLTTPSSIVEAGDAALPAPERGRADVALEAVSFRYRDAAREALGGIDLTLPSGGSLALVGATGAGKSTIVKLLARFYDPTSGTVRYNGADLRRLNLHEYRSRLGVVPQEAHLFAGTVAGNIAYGRPGASREEIAEAARRVGAAAMIAALPGGMTFPIAERGRGLSAGQRQLLALARAELVEPDLILLDEATASLDQATEAQVLAAGTELTRRRTSVIVAHRLSTAAGADAIAVIDHGAVVELGTHRELLAADGRYARLWAAGVGPDEDR